MKQRPNTLVTDFPDCYTATQKGSRFKGGGSKAPGADKRPCVFCSRNVRKRPRIVRETCALLHAHRRPFGESTWGSVAESIAKWRGAAGARGTFGENSLGRVARSVAGRRCPPFGESGLGACCRDSRGAGSSGKAVWVCVGLPGARWVSAFGLVGPIRFCDLSRRRPGPEAALLTFSFEDGCQSTQPAGHFPTHAVFQYRIFTLRHSLAQEPNIRNAPPSILPKVCAVDPKEQSLRLRFVANAGERLVDLSSRDVALLLSVETASQHSTPDLPLCEASILVSAQANFHETDA